MSFCSFILIRVTVHMFVLSVADATLLVRTSREEEEPFRVSRNWKGRSRRGAQEAEKDTAAGAF